MLRDIALALIIMAVCIVALRRPWISILGWTWISLMNPHTSSREMKLGKLKISFLNHLRLR